jgi:cytidine deaminase
VSDEAAPTLTPDAARALLARAIEARRHAYAPYSDFPVGAALLAHDGTVFTGCNVENASYGLCNCAERVAVGTAVAHGVRAFAAVAVVGPEDGMPCAPCGACRQVLYEFGPEMLVIAPDDGATEAGYTATPLKALLPGAFDPSRLGRR